MVANEEAWRNLSVMFVMFLSLINIVVSAAMFLLDGVAVAGSVTLFMSSLAIFYNLLLLTGNADNGEVEK
jgi:hypothetical protein